MLCALATRPKLLLLDEPFAGLDPSVTEDLLGALLASAADEGWTALVASQDIDVIERIADWVGVLEHGQVRVAEPTEQVHMRCRRLNVLAPEPLLDAYPADGRWLSVERTRRQLTFITEDASDEAVAAEVQARFPWAERITVEPVSLREYFVALARASRAERVAEIRAAEAKAEAEAARGGWLRRLLRGRRARDGG